MSLTKKLLLASAAALMAVSAQAENMPKKIGYVTNYATHEWYQNVIKGMKAHGAELGIDVEVQDANLDIAKQVAAAEDFIAKGVDVLIITPVNEEGVVPLLREAKAAKIPVVLEGNPVKGMTTMVAICDYDAGARLRVLRDIAPDHVVGLRAAAADLGLPKNRVRQVLMVRRQ